METLYIDFIDDGKRAMQLLVINFHDEISIHRLDDYLYGKRGNHGTRREAVGVWNVKQYKFTCA